MKSILTKISGMKTAEKVLLWFVSVVLGAFLLTTFLLWNLAGDARAAGRFIKTMAAIQMDYFRDVSDTKLWDGATEGMVRALDDPHSMVLMGENFDMFMSQTSGEYGGIGILLGLDGEGALRILKVFPKSAAEEAGLLEGDVILSVDSLQAQDATLEEISDAIRGEAGTVVKLRILRDGEEKEWDVTRSQIAVPTVEERMLTDDIGYLHIYMFAQTTGKEFQEKLANLKSQGAQKLVIDLRMNPGGVVDTVTEVADELLTGGTIVSYRSKRGVLHSYDIKGVEKPLPMVVLIDGNSASGAEILAGAVQDKKEGTVIGETSYGKGTIQSVSMLSDSEALKLSIAEYLTAAGRKIDKVGIKPDIEVAPSGRMFDPETDGVMGKAVEILRMQNLPSGEGQAE